MDTAVIFAVAGPTTGALALTATLMIFVLGRFARRMDRMDAKLDNMREMLIALANHRHDNTGNVGFNLPPGT